MQAISSGLAAGVPADFRRLIVDPRVRDFCTRLSAVENRCFAKSWVGVNLLGGLLSLKVYFTFYERFPAATLAAILPDEEMRADFLATLPLASPRFAANPLAPGSGTTFCLKIDRGGRLTHGFYFRVGDGGTGIFRLYGRTRHTKEYAYVTAPRAKEELARRFSLPIAAGCEVLEHGRGRGHGFASGEGDEKIVLIGDFAAVRGELFDPDELEMLAALETAHGLRTACGGLYRHGVKSFYLAGPWDRARDRVRTAELVVEEAGPWR
jgi:hypothetical protein